MNILELLQKITKKNFSRFLPKMYENGKFTEEISEQYYDEQAGEFLATDIL